MEVVVQDLAVATDTGILTNRDLLSGVNRCPTYSSIIANFNLCSLSASDNDRPTVKANQITEKAALDGDVLSNLQLGTAFVKDDRSRT